ncbi:hypothetical protein [Leptospira santarosai]|uniref:hypothetical protein n=1 Tax=Leptospira santarosai TaxID=28183 RepID=UPI002014CCA8|nr:hypothetical protein [Leptospira santarosai]
MVSLPGIKKSKLETSFSVLSVPTSITIARYDFPEGNSLGTTSLCEKKKSPDLMSSNLTLYLVPGAELTPALLRSLLACAKSITVLPP